MTLGKAIILLLVLAHLDRCARAWCDLLDLSASPEQHVEGTILGAAYAGDALIVVAGEGSSRTLSRVDANGRSVKLATIDIEQPFGEGLVEAAGSRWWYAATGLRGRQLGTLFLAGDAGEMVHATFVPHTVHTSFMWLPLKGNKPRGLLVFYKSEEELEAREVTPEGEGRSWTFQAPPYYGFGIIWSAQPLADGRIALVTADGRPDLEQQLMLRLLGDGGAMEQRQLRVSRRFDHIAAALDSDGRLAIVCESQSDVDATIIDPMETSTAASNSSPDPPWRRLAEDGRRPEVIATRRGFVVAWCGDPGPIHICELNQRTAALHLFASDDRASVVLQHGSEDDLLIANGPTFQRIPDDVAAAALLVVMRRAAESAARALSGPPHGGFF